MPDEPKSMSAIRRILPYTTAATIVAALYAFWIFGSRWYENRRIDQAMEEQKAKADRRITELYGDGKLKILEFYVTPGVIARGEKALLCYGVANAKTVKIEPTAERIWPSASRCFDVAPRHDTPYKLTAEDSAG